LLRYPHPGVGLQQQNTTGVEHSLMLRLEYAAPEIPSNYRDRIPQMSSR